MLFGPAFQILKGEITMGIIIKQAKPFEINANSRKTQRLRKLEHTMKLAQMQVQEMVKKEETEKPLEIKDLSVEQALNNLNNL